MADAVEHLARAAAGLAPLLAVTDLRTSFATSEGRVTAVDGVSLEIRPGETVGIVGESGSGKTVLVRSIAGLLPATATVSGAIRFEGEEIDRLPQARRRHLWGKEIAMVFQNPMTSLNPVRTIGAQIRDPLRFHLGLDRRQANARARELLDHVRIAEAARRLDQYPHELSGGMRQRIAIAIAVACSPKLLIADEPTTALDVTVQRQVLQLLATLQAEMGLAVILISHDLAVVERQVSRTLIMYAGRVVESGDTVDVFAATAHPYTHALIGATPRIDAPSHTRLAAIPGNPPDLRRLGTGCAFAPRCSRAAARCREEVPAPAVTQSEDASHEVACFHPVNGVRQLAASQLPAPELAVGAWQA
jgi:peptide/nickel transport system ATP-binding protein